MDEVRIRRHFPRRGHLNADGTAGLTVGIASVPDGMAASVPADVNPIHGLYATMAGSIVGGGHIGFRCVVRPDGGK